MAGYSRTITANGTYYICDIFCRPDATNYLATLYASGTFGSGTIAWNWSPDAGTTLLPIRDLSGNALTSTGNDSFNTQFGNATGNQAKPQIYAVLSGATSPSIKIGALDNR